LIVSAILDLSDCLPSLHLVTCPLTLTALLCIPRSCANQDPHATQVAIPSLDHLDHSHPDSHNPASYAPKSAIIGAGVTGASSAHHLHQLTRLSQPLSITVFDNENHVGGRIRNAHVCEEPGYDVESGATAFSEDDWCLKEAMQEVGLKPRPPYS